MGEKKISRGEEESGGQRFGFVITKDVEDTDTSEFSEDILSSSDTNAFDSCLVFHPGTFV